MDQRRIIIGQPVQGPNPCLLLPWRTIPRELLKAKNMLLLNLENTWTIHDLARQVGLSERRLRMASASNSA